MYRNISQWTEIRRRVLDTGESRRSVARAVGMSRTTVRKILSFDLPPPIDLNGSRQRRKILPIAAALWELVIARQEKLDGAPSTIREMYLRLKRNAQYAGSYSTIQREVSEILNDPWMKKNDLHVDIEKMLMKLPKVRLVKLLTDAYCSKSLVPPFAASWFPAAKETSNREDRQKKWRAFMDDIDQKKVLAARSSNATDLSENSALIAYHRAAPNKSSRNKALILLARDAGFSNLQIASQVGLSPKTVRKHIQRFKMGGIEAVYARKPRPLMSDDPTIKATVLSTLHEPPSLYGINRTTWKMVDLRQALAGKGVSIGLHVIRRVLKDAGYRWRRAKVVLTSRDPDYREKLQHVQDVLSKLGNDERFFSIDEYGPFAIKAKGGRKLVAVDMEYTVPQWQKSKGCLILTAGLELSRNQITHFYSTRKNTNEMIRLLDVLFVDYHDAKKLYLSWDAASWHMSKKLNEYIAASNALGAPGTRPLVELAPLPAGAQFLNVIESVFSGMAREIIHNSDYGSVEEAKAAIDRYVADRNQYYLLHPKKAGKKIWGKERAESEFSASGVCKDPAYR